MTKTARCSSGLLNNRLYECKFSWPEECFVQCGDKGIVLTRQEQTDGSHAYRTAFFEAFPRNPDTFIRGEGESIEEAEDDAYKQYLHFSNCLDHEYERRDYTNGAGFCIHCGMFKGKAFEPIRVPCVICSQPTRFMSDKEGNYYGIECWRKMPKDQRWWWVFDEYANDDGFVKDCVDKYRADFADGGPH